MLGFFFSFLNYVNVGRGMCMQQTQMPGLSGVTGCSELHDVGSECVGGEGEEWT